MVGQQVRCVSCVFLVVLVATIGAAQQNNTGPDAKIILLRANSAMGCAAINANTTIAVSGSLQAAGNPTPMHLTIQSEGNQQWRSELDTPKERKVTIINNGKGQVQHADGRVAGLAEHNTSHQRPMHIPCLTNLALPPGAIDTTYLRTETIGADTLYVIDLELKGRPSSKRAADLMKTTVWISQSTGYLAKLQYVNAAEQDPNDTQTVEIDYTDYRIVEGLAVPFHQITHSGQFTLDLQLDSVQLNGPAADFSLR